MAPLEKGGVKFIATIISYCPVNTFPSFQQFLPLWIHFFVQNILFSLLYLPSSTIPITPPYPPTPTTKLLYSLQIVLVTSFGPHSEYITTSIMSSPDVTPHLCLYHQAMSFLKAGTVLFVSILHILSHRPSAHVF